VNLTRRHILLIEDNPGDARLIRELLADASVLDHQVTWAETLAGGLTSLSEGNVDVILLDLSLPDSHGLETFTAVRDNAPALPIVVLSGSIDDEIALAAVQAGAQDYLVKGKVEGYLLGRSLSYAIERNRNEQTRRFLAEASRGLATTLDVDLTIQNVARLTIPFLADCCIIDLIDENQQPRQSALAHQDPAKEIALRAYRQRFPVDLRAHHALGSVIQTGQAAVYRDFTDPGVVLTSSTGEQLAAESAFDFRSGIFVPLLARGRTLGAICLFTAGSRKRFEQTDLTLATDLGHRAALAIDNAQLYRQSTDAIRSRDLVLSSVSHDLRNPLTAIRLIAETTKLQVGQEPMRDIEAIQEGLERIESNTQRMASQIDELLDVAYFQSGQKVRLTLRLADLVALAKESIHEHQQRTSRHRIILQSTTAAVPGRWDRARLERVVGNLLSNAIKYSLTGGDIVVRIGIEGTDQTRWATLAVQDSGVGIPATDLPRVFSWFYRGENIASRVEGAGIGLATSRQIVELHGGTVRVESQEGVGSTFTIRLPLPPEAY
jgi:signal transduction histidine kinase/CheY-like chemotaxis protein